MASSNRNWPSMFKSKPSRHPWQHDFNSSFISPPNYHRSPYTPVPGCEERTPEPKPRWNPRPEQIRILEAIFNAGMVNPPREEIRKIRVQLQEFGQVGDANVFYWFQNRKSRSKHKQRQLQNTAKSQPQSSTNFPISGAGATNVTKNMICATVPTSSASSSANNSDEKVLSIGSASMIHSLLNSPTASVNQPSFLQTPSDFLTEPFVLPMQQAASTADLTQGFCFPQVSGVTEPQPDNDGNCASFLLGEHMALMDDGFVQKAEEEKMKLQQHELSYAAAAAAAAAATPSAPPPADHILPGLREMGTSRSTHVFINDVCFEVGWGALNVKEAFGEDAVLVQSSGQPVLTNEWGITLQPLRHGEFYYLLRGVTPSTTHYSDRTIHLI